MADRGGQGSTALQREQVTAERMTAEWGVFFASFVLVSCPALLPHSQSGHRMKCAVTTPMGLLRAAAAVEQHLYRVVPTTRRRRRTTYPGADPRRTRAQQLAASPSYHRPPRSRQASSSKESKHRTLARWLAICYRPDHESVAITFETAAQLPACHRRVYQYHLPRNWS